MVPSHGKPGDKITIKGRVFTKEYGNSNFGDGGPGEEQVR